MTGEFLAVEAIVEIPRGSRNKYEFDPKSRSHSSRPRSLFVGALPWRLRIHRRDKVR